MPRSTTSKRATRNRQVVDGVEAPMTGAQTVTSATATETDETTVRELPFKIDITPADPDFKPDRSPAGRKRLPSPFETVLPELKGKGWQNQPHDGNVVAVETEDGKEKYNTTDSVKDSNARVILRELSKAVKFLNSEEGGELDLGLDVNVTAELVQFNVRAKQNRKPRTAPGGGEVSDGESDSDSSGDE